MIKGPMETVGNTSQSGLMQKIQIPKKSKKEIEHELSI
jgi:hypothetical protein